MDSVLQQTYPNVEMIMIDNASTDDTANIIRSYIPVFKKKGYSLTYHLEEDLGPSIGLCNGMKMMHGDYVTFPDSDDYYSRPDSLELMVNKLNSLSDEYVVVRSMVQQIDEKTMQPCGIWGENISDGEEKNLFEDCLFAQNGYYYINIGYMIRVSALKEITGLDFYAAYNVGPGRQVYLPLYYYKKCFSIKQILSHYLVRENSISHGDYSKYKVRAGLYKQCSLYFDSILAPISDLSIEATLGGEGQIYFKSKQKVTERMLRNVLDKYYNDYIKCPNCKSFKTILRKDQSTRLPQIYCEVCKGEKTIQNIKSRGGGGKRKK
jgi:glycosyltransferase involved in cell wall biosynthesis